ncbi:MAG: GlsB/YeaQ/YmgE family stress response membrane protein [Gemmatimonadota bacterium]
MFTLIGWLIFGAVVGGIAKLIMPGKDPGGCLVTIGLGILGSIVGGLILGLILPGRSALDPAGWIGSILGAILLLWLYRRWVGKRATTP